MAEYDPSDATVEDVLKKLKRVDDTERERILAAERAGKARVTILEAYGLDPNQRVDATGRVLYPWEVEPANEVRRVEVEETDEERKARELQAEQDLEVEKVAAANHPDEQGGVTAAGVGVAGPAIAGGVTGPGGPVTGGPTTTGPAVP